AAARNSLIEQVLGRCTRLRRADAEIISSAALDLNLGFIILRHRVHTGYPVSSGRSVDREIKSLGDRTDCLAVDLDSRFSRPKSLLAQKIQARYPHALLF